MKKKFIAGLAVCMSAVSALTFTACGNNDEPLGEHEKGDRTEITFLCASNDTSEAAWKEMVKAYNDGQGLEDKVFVTFNKKGSLAPADTVFKRSAESASNVVAISDSQDAFQKLVIQRDSRRAPNGLFLDLTSYAAADEDFQNNTISENLLNWWRVTRNPDAEQGVSTQKHIIGAGQKLMGVPYGTNAHFNWYNEAIFKAQNINIVSVQEEAMEEYNTANNASLKPHGYAEYKTAPVAGMTSSKNLAGETVYKVFNNCIGMNWEEQRHLLKYFTPVYNGEGSVTGTPATTSYGFVSEYWFNYGWSVGGDVMGYNGTDYDFTLLDKHPNYIVTADNTTIGGSVYNKGDIVRYEDRVKALDNASTLPANVYAIESQYNAVKEYVSLQLPSSVVVDSNGGTTYYGYGVGDPDTGSADNWFNTGKLAMMRGTAEGIAAKMSRTNAADFNMCPAETYREYEGGSVYYNGGTDFAHEYLRVVGETYTDLVTDDNPDGVYSGDLKVVNGTKIVGSTSTASISQGLVIPACSDPAKYQASWDFISWVATDGQKYVAKTKTVAPAAASTLLGEDYAKNSALNYGKNFYAVAKASLSAGRGDWGYFENGSWVTNWSGDFNDRVRKSGDRHMTLSAFETAHKVDSKTDLNNMYCIIKGIR